MLELQWQIISKIMAQEKLYIHTLFFQLSSSQTEVNGFEFFC